MANRYILLCLFIACLSVNIECWRSSGRGSSRGHGSYKPSYSKPSYSKPSYSKPSYSKPSYSKPSYSSRPTSSHSYPSSSSGLSGGSSKPSYPSGGGLSGSSSVQTHSYPSGSGLSGSSSGSHKYPSQSTGLSGSSSGSQGHMYPTSINGLSGNKQSTSWSNSQSPSVSNPNYGSNTNHHHIYHPSHTYNTNTVPSSPVFVPSYYSSPQYVYVNEYRNSDSRFGDILTGLTLYNLGRSHSHYHGHHYYDDYYRRRYESPSYTGYQPARPNDEAICTLKIKESGKLEVLRIPCEIVSTFTEDSRKETPKVETQVNTTVCTTKTTTINYTLPVNGSSVNSTLTANSTVTGNSTVTANNTMVNVTVCTTNSTVNTTMLDPMSVKGPKVDSVGKNMECIVEIKTKDAFLQNGVDCSTLLKYSKMPEPKKDAGILPPRQKLKSWLSNPPWWLSIFIAV